MPGWRIYYADGARVDGRTRGDWQRAPDTGVEVVAVDGPPPAPLPDRFATGYVHTGRTDRTFYTGVDAYDPFGWGAKAGTLMPDADYRALWDRAYGDD